MLSTRTKIGFLVGGCVAGIAFVYAATDKDPTKCDMVIKDNPVHAYQPAAYTVFGYVVSECIDFGVELPVQQDATTRQLFIRDERGNVYMISPYEAEQAGVVQ